MGSLGRIALLGVVAARAEAQAPATVPATDERPVEVELVSAARAVVPGETTWVAVRLKPNRGWHTYWYYAGDVGSARNVVWNLPSGWKAGALSWIDDRPSASAKDIAGATNIFAPRSTRGWRAARSRSPRPSPTAAR
jgi:hypothetical protein